MYAYFSEGFFIFTSVLYQRQRSNVSFFAIPSPHKIMAKVITNFVIRFSKDVMSSTHYQRKERNNCNSLVRAALLLSSKVCGKSSQVQYICNVRFFRGLLQSRLSGKWWLLISSNQNHLQQDDLRANEWKTLSKYISYNFYILYSVIDRSNRGQRRRESNRLDRSAGNDLNFNNKLIARDKAGWK